MTQHRANEMNRPVRREPTAAECLAEAQRRQAQLTSAQAIAVRHSDVLSLRLSPDVTALIAQAAAARGQRPAEWHRQAIRTQLALEGFDLTVAVRPAAGDPEWALVQVGDPDLIVTIRHSGDKPDAGPAGSVWVPVENCDSEPGFDLATHWRLKPSLEIVSVYATPDRVRRVYPIVLKNWEHA